MVTKLLKFAFVTNQAAQTGAPNFAFLLPKSLSDLYQDYYRSGTGQTIFILFLILIFGWALFSKSKYSRYISRLALLLTVLLWPISKSITIANTIVPLNVIQFPIPRIPIVFYFVVFFMASLLSYLYFRKILQRNCRKMFVLFSDGTFILLLFFFLMPFWTGELFQI